MPYVDYQAIRDRVPIGRVLALMGWRERTRRGAQARGPCPLHNTPLDRSRSFAVHLDADKWYCHRCKTGGDVIDLYAAWKGLDTSRAAVQLCEHAGVPIPLKLPTYSAKGTEKRNGA